MMDVKKLRAGDKREWGMITDAGEFIVASDGNTPLEIGNSFTVLTLAGTVDINESTLDITSRWYARSLTFREFIDEFCICPDKDEISRLRDIIDEAMNASRGAMAGAGCHNDSDLPRCITDLVEDLKGCRRYIWECQETLFQIPNAGDGNTLLEILKKVVRRYNESTEKIKNLSESSEACHRDTKYHAALNIASASHCFGPTVVERIKSLGNELAKGKEEACKSNEILQGARIALCDAFGERVGYDYDEVIVNTHRIIKERDELRNEIKTLHAVLNTYRNTASTNLATFKEGKDYEVPCPQHVTKKDE